MKIERNNHCLKGMTISGYEKYMYSEQIEVGYCCTILSLFDDLDYSRRSKTRRLP